MSNKLNIGNSLRATSHVFRHLQLMRSHDLTHKRWHVTLLPCSRTNTWQTCAPKMLQTDMFSLCSGFKPVVLPRASETIDKRLFHQYRMIHTTTSSTMKHPNEEKFEDPNKCFYNKFFDYLSDADNTLSVAKFMKHLRKFGLRDNDPRIKECVQMMLNLQTEAVELDQMASFKMTREMFKECVSGNSLLLSQAFRNQFVIPEFEKFTNHIETMFWAAKANTRGNVASYIPPMARQNPETWGLAICTVDGQRYAIGDAFEPVCLQSVSKALSYMLALDEHGPRVMHQYMGQEPSGQAFNKIYLDNKRRPHNPMINPGAIVSASLIKQDMNLSDRFDYVQRMFRKMANNEFVTFNNAVFLSERATSDRNFAIGYYLKENKCFPSRINMHEALDLYIQLCSIETTCDSGAVIAATLANGGICPISGEKVVEPHCVRDTLSLMLSCGMYDYSGQFAFKVGLPAKSGVSGAVLLVVPNIMGIYMWSPLLDAYGNSYRGIQFCRDLVREFNFHNYDNLRFTEKKLDPRVITPENQSISLMNIHFSAFNGDLTALRRFALMDLNMDQVDYDGRTALHIAAAEGHVEVASFLLDKCDCSPFIQDRWGQFPIDDARKFERHEVEDILEKSMVQRSGNHD